MSVLLYSVLDNNGQELNFMINTTERIILSVHLPRTAGTTLLQILRRALGEKMVVADYADDPCDPDSPRNLDPDGYFSRPSLPPIGCRAVHGHFHINKYATTPNAFRIAFLRNPVDTILSIHAYWQTLGPGRHRLHDYFLNNRLDVFDTARLPLLRHLLTRSYFQGVDMGSFDFIGRFESFPDEIKRLSSKLELSLVADVHLNQVGKSLPLRHDIAHDPKVRARLRDILIDDVTFFEAITGIDARGAE